MLVGEPDDNRESLARPLEQVLGKGRLYATRCQDVDGRWPGV